MTVPEPARCYVCRRSEAEVSAFTNVESPQEKEILQQMSQVTRSKADFFQSADVWRKGVPMQLQGFDFQFVTSNVDQFKSIRMLGEICEAKKATFDWLEKVALAIRKGDGEVPGFGPLSPFEKADRDMLGSMVNQFEAKWHRRLGSEGSDSTGYKSGLEGLKLFDGLELMIAAGFLYYDVQAQLLEMARKQQIKSKPKRGVSVQRINGYPPIPLCSVCAELMNGLGSHTVQAAAPPLGASSAR